MCIVFSIIERVYWYLRVILSSMFVVGNSYVSFFFFFFICIHFVIFLWEWDEWHSRRDSESLSFPSLRSLLMWLHSMFDLSWSHFSSYIHCFTIILVIACDSSHSLHLIILFLHWSIPGLIFFSHHSCISHYQFDFASSSHYWYCFHIGHPQVHGSRHFLYIFHFIYEGIGFSSLGIWA